MVDIKNDLFKFSLNKEYDGPLPFFVICPLVDISESDNIKMWVLERSPEENNEIIDSLIIKAGLVEYDAYGFFRYNKGRHITDRFYVDLLN